MAATKAKNTILALLRLGLTLALVYILYHFFRPICREPDGTLNTFLLAVLIGIPFGICQMVIILPPESYGISGGIGVIALDFIIGGIIGFFALCVLFVKRVAAVFAAVFG